MAKSSPEKLAKKLNKYFFHHNHVYTFTISLVSTIARLANSQIDPFGKM